MNRISPRSCGGSSLGGRRVNSWLLPTTSQMEGGPQVRIVLCDNNRILCEALAPMLQACGHPVLAIATTASDSIAAVATNRPDACCSICASQTAASRCRPGNTRPRSGDKDRDLFSHH